MRHGINGAARPLCEAYIISIHACAPCYCNPLHKLSRRGSSEPVPNPMNRLIESLRQKLAQPGDDSRTHTQGHVHFIRPADVFRGDNLGSHVLCLRAFLAGADSVGIHGGRRPVHCCLYYLTPILSRQPHTTAAESVIAICITMVVGRI